MHSSIHQPSAGSLTPLDHGTMLVPQRIPGCPPGLEYLTVVDQLLIQQDVDISKVIAGCVENSRFHVKNTMGQKVYNAKEDNDWCNRNCCGPSRSFLIGISDLFGQEVMTVTRPQRCGSCCFPCCLQELEVQSPPGNPIGYVIQNWHPYLPKFTIQNERKEQVLKIVGPFCTCRCYSEVTFEVTTLDETTLVGAINKQWSGFSQEMFTDADKFQIKFPLDLDVKMKAVLLGACFHINFMYFER